ncbi:MAG: hypothetical protein M3Q71_07855 [Chloroflexota bacterium]|nr:hypothetical protein [Chloroflexota bacterium]
MKWKNQERQIAAALNGVRLPNSGTGQPDVRAGRYAIQVKARETLPAWLTGAVEQAARDADAGEIPVVVLSEVSQGRKARRLVVLDFDHWRDMAGRAGGDRSPQSPAGGNVGVLR